MHACVVAATCVSMLIPAASRARAQGSGVEDEHGVTVIAAVRAAAGAGPRALVAAGGQFGIEVNARFAASVIVDRWEWGLVCSDDAGIGGDSAPCGGVRTYGAMVEYRLASPVRPQVSFGVGGGLFAHGTMSRRGFATAQGALRWPVLSWMAVDTGGRVQFQRLYGEGNPFFVAFIGLRFCVLSSGC